MAKLSPKTIYCVAVRTGQATGYDGNPRNYEALVVSEDPTAKGGMIKFCRQDSVCLQTVLESLEDQGVELEYGETPQVFNLPEAVDLGKGFIFENTSVPKVKQIRTMPDGTTRFTLLASVRGCALSADGETVQGVTQREMIRRCNNTEQFSPVKGEDYSEFRFADTSWEEVDRLLGFSAEEEEDDDEG